MRRIYKTLRPRQFKYPGYKMNAIASPKLTLLALSESARKAFARTHRYLVQQTIEFLKRNFGRRNQRTGSHGLCCQNDIFSLTGTRKKIRDAATVVVLAPMVALMLTPGARAEPQKNSISGSTNSGPYRTSLNAICSAGNRLAVPSRMITFPLVASPFSWQDRF